MLPSGTPCSTFRGSERTPPYLTRWRRSDRYDLNHNTALLLSPTARSAFNRIEWFTHSNALLELVVVTAENWPCCRTVNISFESLSNAASVLRPRRKPNCDVNKPEGVSRLEVSCLALIFSNTLDNVGSSAIGR